MRYSDEQVDGSGRFYASKPTSGGSGDLSSSQRRPGSLVVLNLVSFFLDDLDVRQLREDHRLRRKLLRHRQKLQSQHRGLLHRHQENQRQRRKLQRQRWKDMELRRHLKSSWMQIVLHELRRQRRQHQHQRRKDQKKIERHRQEYQSRRREDQIQRLKLLRQFREHRSHRQDLLEVHHYLKQTSTPTSGESTPTSGRLMATSEASMSRTDLLRQFWDDLRVQHRLKWSRMLF
ncbi:unnamed protein product [Caenorhabditis nigoni]